MRIFTLVTFLFFASLAAKAQSTRTDASDAVRVSIFPNPASDYVHIRLDDPEAESTKVVMYSIIGSEIPSEREIIDDFELRIRVKDLPAGYYLLSIGSGERNNRISRKFIKR